MNKIKQLPNESNEDYIKRVSHYSVKLRRGKRTWELVKRRRDLKCFLNEIIEITVNCKKNTNELFLHGSKV